MLVTRLTGEEDLPVTIKQKHDYSNNYLKLLVPQCSVGVIVAKQKHPLSLSESVSLSIFFKKSKDHLQLSLLGI